MNGSTLLWGVVFSCIGIGFFRYGKKQDKLVPYATGIGLMLMPYFVESTLWLVLGGLALMAVPYFVRY
jgi:hypothetical protein